MTPRRVMLSIEVETDLSLRELRKVGYIGIGEMNAIIAKDIKQVQVNVIKKEKA